MKKHSLIISVFILILLSGFEMLSQTVTNDTELDRKYTPNSSSIFNNLLKKKNESGGSESGSEIEIKNSIKFCSTMLLRQKVTFLYERDIYDGISLNLGIGKAFGNDYIQTLFLSTFSEFDEGSVLSPTDIIFNSEYSGSTPLLSLGARLYFSGTTFEDGFVEFNYRRETMRYLLAERINDGYSVDGDRGVDFKMNAFNFGFGYTGLSGSNNNITHEFFCYVGLKNIGFSRYEKVDNPTVLGQNGNYVYVKSPIDLQTRILPSIQMGYAFGFGF